MKRIVMVAALAFILGALCVSTVIKASPGEEGGRLYPRWVTITKEGVLTRWYVGETTILVLREIQLGLRSDGVVVWKNKFDQ